jgi:hypothetical protein
MSFAFSRKRVANNAGSYGGGGEHHTAKKSHAHNHHNEGTHQIGFAHGRQSEYQQQPQSIMTAGISVPTDHNQRSGDGRTDNHDSDGGLMQQAMLVRINRRIVIHSSGLISPSV